MIIDSGAVSARCGTRRRRRWRSTLTTSWRPSSTGTAMNKRLKPSVPGSLPDSLCNYSILYSRGFFTGLTFFTSHNKYLARKWIPAIFLPPRWPNFDTFFQWFYLFTRILYVWLRTAETSWTRSTRNLYCRHPTSNQAFKVHTLYFLNLHPVSVKLSTLCYSKYSVLNKKKNFF